jgi:hypothetical protein
VQARVIVLPLFGDDWLVMARRRRRRREREGVEQPSPGSEQGEGLVKVRVRSRRRHNQERENLRRYHRGNREDPLLFIAVYGIGMLVVVSLGVAAFSGFDRLYNSPQQPTSSPVVRP